MAKIAIVTGSSSGTGLETSLLLARNQFFTYATMRNLNKGEEILQIAAKDKLPLKTLQLDVNDDLFVNNAMSTVLEENGRVDVLVNNAGYSMFGSLEELSFEEIKGQFETNFFGVLRTCKEVIPTMRKQGNGTIINIGSLGGRVGLLPFLTQYHASKFALEGFTESLRQELDEFGVNVVLIEPGTIRTNFENNTKIAKNYNPESSPYASTVQKLFEGVESISANSSHPRDVAEMVLEIVNTSNPNVRYTVGKDAESVLKKRAELSDMEMEKWVRESFLEKKGFMR